MPHILRLGLVPTRITVFRQPRRCHPEGAEAMRVDLDSELFSSAHALMTRQQSIKIRQWESWNHTRINSTNTHSAEPVTAQGCNQVLDSSREHVLISLDRESSNLRRQPNVFETKSHRANDRYRWSAVDSRRRSLISPACCGPVQRLPRDDDDVIDPR